MPNNPRTLGQTDTRVPLTPADAVFSVQTAIHRDLHWMARGHAAYESIVIKEIADNIFSLAEPKAGGPAAAYERIRVSLAYLQKVAEDSKHSYFHVLNENDGLLYTRIAARITSIDVENPFPRDSDRKRWYPFTQDDTMYTGNGGMALTESQYAYMRTRTLQAEHLNVATPKNLRDAGLMARRLENFFQSPESYSVSEGAFICDTLAAIADFIRIQAAINAESAPSETSNT